MATTTQDPRSLDSEATYELIQPFSEAAFEKPNGHDRSAVAAQWAETVSPFTEAPDRASTESEADRLMSEALDELRDEGFDEAVANLAEETEQAIGDRFSNELPSSAAERERYGDAHLANVRFESHQYLEALEAGLQGLSLESLNEQQLDEVLDRLDPETRDLTPAGEEFIGSLIKKAKKAVTFVHKTATSIGGKVAGAVLGPVLKKLRGLINPLLRRVLSFAIGRLPAALQPAARTLASKFQAEAEAEAEAEEFSDEAPMSPANLTDVEALADSFDEALAEAVTNFSDEGFDNESLEELDQLDSEGVDGRQLEALAEARGELIDRLNAADDSEDLAPVVEQFVPAILGALRLGISLIGRPKVVGFLAKYLGQLIQKWVGPQQSGPLSNAIADTGLRLATLEAESGEAADSRETAGPVALASVVEDTVRKLAENEDYVFENEDLTQLAVAEAFSQAVATHFPSQFVRPALQQAPSLGGTFMTRRPRSVRRYFKYTRTPDVEVTAQVADAIPTFGGSSLGAVLRAAGASFPVRARMHIYQAAVGTTLPRMMRVDRRQPGGRRFGRAAVAHPLTPAAAGLLLREPALGVAVPARFMRSRHRIAAGQRFFHLEPTGPASMLALQETSTPRPAAPTRAWTVINLRKARVTVGFYLSETESQTLVTAMRARPGGAALLQALIAAYKGMDGSGHGRGRVRILREDGEDFEELAAGLGKIASRLTGSLRKRLRAWVLPALAAWVRTNAESFARAAAAPEDGVTIRVRLTGVPGLDLIGRLPGVSGVPGRPSMPRIPRGTPSINITVSPGGPKK